MFSGSIHNLSGSAKLNLLKAAMWIFILMTAWVVPAQEVLVDFRAKAPQMTVNIDGQEGRKVSWAEQTGGNTIDVGIGILLPEFEQAGFDLNVFVPKNSSAKKIIFEFVGKPGMHPHWNMGKYYTAETAPLIADGKWRTVHAVFDLDPILKSGQEPFPLKLIKLTIVYSKHPETADYLYLGELNLERLGLYCTLETGKDIAVYDMRDTKTPPRLIVANGGPAPCSAEISYTVKTVDGKIQDSGSHKFELSNGARQVIDLKTPKQYGVYYIEYSLVKNGNQELKQTQKLSYAAMCPTGHPAKLFADYKNGEFLFSVHAHLMNYPLPEVKKLVEYVALAGLNHVRSGTCWPSVQPKKGVWDYRRSDEILALLTENNIEREEELFWAPPWAVDPAWKKTGHGGIPYPQFEPYGEWVKTFVGRLKGKVRMFEIINEVNLTPWTPEQYIDYQKFSYKKLKEANPDALLLSGSWGGIVPSVSWQEKLYREAPDTSDIIAVHNHCPFELDINPVKDQGVLLKRHQIKQPWFANESAWTSTDDAFLAETLFKRLLYNWANGSIGYTWYNLRNSGWDPKNGEHNFGLLREDLSPRAAYVTYNMLCGVYRESRFKSEINLKPDLYSFRFENREQAMIPLWNMSRDVGCQAVALRTDAKKAETIDLYGNVSPLPVNDGVLVLNITGQPETLRLTPANASLTYAGRLIDSKYKLIVAAGMKKEFQFKVLNPFPVESEVEVTIVPPEGMTASPPAGKLSIAAGKEAVFPVGIETAKNFAVGTNPKTTFAVDWSVPAKKVEGQTVFNLQSVVLVNAKKNYANFSCDRREQYTNLLPVKPGDPYLWGGVKDLGAWIFVWPASPLHIRVCVDDDIHNQPFHKIEMYKGDNLQLMFLFPNQKSRWEIGISLNNDGTHESYIWMAPSGFDKALVANQIEIRTSRNLNVPNKTLWYDIYIPLKSVGVTWEELKKSGFRFNVMINDNDGSGRKGYMSMITGDPKDIDNFPCIQLEQ